MYDSTTPLQACVSFVIASVRFALGVAYSAGSMTRRHCFPSRTRKHGTIAAPVMSESAAGPIGVYAGRPKKSTKMPLRLSTS